jgi:exonuclease III
MWKRLSEAGFLADHVILGRGFNHSEETNRRGSVGDRQMRRREVATWHHMTFHYSLSNAWKLDSFRKMTPKKFTFDNGRIGPKLAISRINKFLFSQKLDTRGGRIKAATSVQKLSDHSPLVLTIWG